VQQFVLLIEIKLIMVQVWTRNTY